MKGDEQADNNKTVRGELDCYQARSAVWDWNPDQPHTGGHFACGEFDDASVGLNEEAVEAVRRKRGLKALLPETVPMIRIA